MSDFWKEPVAGFELNQQETIVSAEYQAEKLASQGLDSDVFAGCVDPSFYIGLGIQVGTDSGISAEGNVNMLSSIVMHRPVQLDEVLHSRGQITDVVAVPRGRRISTDVWFEDASGERVISVPRQSLKPDPDAASQRGAGARPAPVIEDPDSLDVGSTHQLTPEGTMGYSREGNAIHYEPEAARRAGFRAPIIGGGQGVHFLMAAIWRHFAARNAGLTPVTLALELFFRRPIFWDQAISVGIEKNFSAVALITPDDAPRKVLTEARINRVG